MKKLVLLAALLSGTTAVAQAEELMYGGVGLGYATQRDDEDPIQSKGKLGGKIYLGYQFNENLALEGAYHYLNKSLLKNESAEGSIKGHLFGLTINGILPVSEQFSLVGKAGIAAYHSHTKGNNGVNDKKTAAAPIIGVGAEFKINKELALRGEYEYFGKPRAANDSKMKRVDMFTISLRATF